MYPVPEPMEHQQRMQLGDIYELIGKARNAHVRGHDQALAVLAVELAQRTAYALGLEHRHLYGQWQCCSRRGGKVARSS